MIFRTQIKIGRKYRLRIHYFPPPNTVFTRFNSKSYRFKINQKKNYRIFQVKSPFLAMRESWKCFYPFFLQ
jgi:hypothetical protein